ncbi:alpha/beta fold hydrolase [Muricauda sp. JGD-17]|uniref:Proline iminopeptidase n=1 Tax=Flagellimonas ochracea TaxID=2696472 RepID=A0A964WWN7_9FLAO|nr:alpha/beta hydrolase [Allomuricauda ochracea]NAY90968.1 alpha/beta fold hydrolase [Allomuricauda ochracea]
MVIKWLVYVLAFLLVLAVASLLVYRSYLKHTTKIKSPNGISSLEEITLGEIKQWIFIRGEDINNPVLVFLHGGPGAPLFGMSSSRKLDAVLIKHFTIVHWDQRGAGKSYHRNIPIKSMSFDRLVEDCNELIDHIRKRLDVKKVFLVAHSGGSIIGIKTAYKYPEKIHAYVGVAQIINDFEQQRISYEYIVEESAKTGDTKKINTIKSLGPPPYESTSEVNKKDNYVFKYGGVLRGSSYKIGLLALNFLTSPEYSLSEGFATIMNKGFAFTSDAMWDEMRSINLTAEIKSVKVPTYFFEGKYDMATPTILVKSFYNVLDAEKGKKLIIFENSAHLPMMEEKVKYEEFLINHVLKEVRPN